MSIKNPEEFSKERLARMRSVMAGYVDRGDMPGLVTLISKRGETHVEAFGKQSLESERPMRRDSIFRIASMSKPITAAAAMVLIEECRLRLDEPVDRWLPELENRRVLREIGSSLDDTVPAKRSITLRDLLTYTMGIGSIMAMPGTYPIQAAIKELQIGGDGPPHPTTAPGPDEWLRRLGTLPLVHQPGERWMYHISADVVGVLIARVTGQTLGTFLRERIFDPLGMKDTGFSVPAGKIDRLTSCYGFDYEAKEFRLYDGGAGGEWSKPSTSESAGGGLVSTADDYLTFCRMLLNNGLHEKLRILSRPAVQLMTMDHLKPEQKEGAEIFLGDHSSWGFGVHVVTGRTDLWTTPGQFGWTGGLGTTGYADPAEDVVGIALTTRLMDSPVPPTVFTDFWTSAYQSFQY